MKSIIKFVSIFFFISFITNCSLPTGSYFASYKLLYNGNGNTAGAVPVSAYDYKYGDIVKVQDNIGSLQKNGSTFLNWNTKTDNTGVAYSANDSVHILSKDVVLYAHYSYERISFSGPEFALNWDAGNTNAGTYKVYVRNHGNTDWTMLSQNLINPSLTINTTILAYGDYDFAVTFTLQGGTETDLHTSLDSTANPTTGWYLIWTE